MAMVYKWIARKPLRRATRTPGKSAISAWSFVEIKPGDIFEPSDAERQSFADCMEAVGAGLTPASTSEPPE